MNLNGMKNPDKKVNEKKGKNGANNYGSYNYKEK